jgi:hypothetical protein
MGRNSWSYALLTSPGNFVATLSSLARVEELLSSGFLSRFGFLALLSAFFFIQPPV